jgi:hypothetical protein
LLHISNYEKGSSYGGVSILDVLSKTLYDQIWVLVIPDI